MCCDCHEIKPHHSPPPPQRAMKETKPCTLLDNKNNKKRSVPRYMIFRLCVKKRASVFENLFQKTSNTRSLHFSNTPKRHSLGYLGKTTLRGRYRSATRRLPSPLGCGSLLHTWVVIRYNFSIDNFDHCL